MKFRESCTKNSFDFLPCQPCKGVLCFNMYAQLSFVSVDSFNGEDNKNERKIYIIDANKSIDEVFLQVKEILDLYY